MRVSRCGVVACGVLERAGTCGPSGVLLGRECWRVVVAHKFFCEAATMHERGAAHQGCVLARLRVLSSGRTIRRHRVDASVNKKKGGQGWWHAMRSYSQ